MEIKTKFNREQKVIVIFDDEIQKGEVDAININLGFKNQTKIKYDIKLEIDSIVIYESFIESKVFASVEDLTQQSKERIKTGS